LFCRSLSDRLAETISSCGSSFLAALRGRFDRSAAKIKKANESATVLHSNLANLLRYFRNNTKCTPRRRVILSSRSFSGYRACGYWGHPADFSSHGNCCVFIGTNFGYTEIKTGFILLAGSGKSPRGVPCKLGAYRTASFLKPDSGKTALPGNLILPIPLR
jgi:hypothetical protein